MKRALIVDDSRLARTVLSRLLSAHGVTADTAESAEVALEYLKHTRPDVVFLDHNMPGIGGFEALEAIKTNPATATIPVMMYTSQEGELYVGQARALGALGVLPKTLQPVEVTKVLRTLRLIPAPGEPAVADTAAGASPATAKAAAPREGVRPLDAETLRQLLEALFSEHTSSLRADMRRELQRFSASTAAAAPPAPVLQAPVISERRETASPRAGSVLKVASVLLIALSGALGYLYYETSASLDAANERTRALTNDIAAITGARAPVVAAGKPALAATPVTRGVLDVLEWGVNQGGRYAFDAPPLDDGRATVLTALVAQLADLGFEGTVAIDVHVGRFCMNYGPGGVLELASAEQPATACEQIGWPEPEALTLGQRRSLGFANVMTSVEARHPRVRIEYESYGSLLPAVEYPRSGYELTAEAWNAVAAANQRVDVRLIADEQATVGAVR
jgi:CheY-like chemotaxis protein